MDRIAGATELIEHPAGWPSPKTLLAVIKDNQPDLDLQRERRHLIMRALYARHYQAQAQARRQGASSTPASDRSLKVARNDPCPCGSGRKYKHRCLDKRA